MGKFQSIFRHFAASGQEGTAVPIRKACWSLHRNDPATERAYSGCEPPFRRGLERL